MNKNTEKLIFDDAHKAPYEIKHAIDIINSNINRLFMTLTIPLNIIKSEIEAVNSALNHDKEQINMNIFKYRRFIRNKLNVKSTAYGTLPIYYNSKKSDSALNEEKQIH